MNDTHEGCVRLVKRWALFAGFIGFVAARGSAVGVELPSLQAANQQPSPCAGQALSLLELRQTFDAATLPSRDEVTGTWVAIAIFGDAASHGTEFAAINCDGLTRDNTHTFEEVLLVNGYSGVPRLLGGAMMPTLNLQPDGKGSLTFPVDLGGDANPFYRCRLTGRGTLACLIDVYVEGREFKKMSVRPDQICQLNQNDGVCDVPRAGR